MGNILSIETILVVLLWCSSSLMGHPTEQNFQHLHSFKGVEGALTYGDYLALNTIAQTKCSSITNRSLRYAEVGSYRGMSATIVAHSCPKSLIFCHDLFPVTKEELTNSSLPPPKASNMFMEFWTGVKRNKLEGQIIPMRGKSSETLILHDDDSLDLVFVDGDHSIEGTLIDLRLMWSKLKANGGILLLHDAIVQEDGEDHMVRKALKLFSNEVKSPFFDIDATWGMVMMTKGESILLKNEEFSFYDKHA
jgi:hypothetical protein